MGPAETNAKNEAKSYEPEPEIGSLVLEIEPAEIIKHPKERCDQCKDQPHAKRTDGAQSGAQENNVADQRDEAR